MSDLRILITASLNEGLSLKELNQKIRSLEKHASLKPIRLKIDVDKNLLNSLKSFNKNISEINQTMGQHNKINDGITQSAKTASSAIDKETRAVQEQNAALKENKTLKKVITTSGDGNLETTKTTSGSRFDYTTTTSARNPRNPGEIIESNASTTRVINEAARIDSEKKAIEARAKLEQEVNDRWLKNLHDRELKEIKANQNAISSRQKLEKETEDRWLKNLYDREQKEKNINLKRISDIDNAEHQAYQEKQKREQHIHGNRIQDQKVAFDLAKKEDATFNQQRLINEQKFARMQQDTLNKIEKARMQFGHYPGVNDKLDGLMISAQNMKAVDDFGKRIPIDEINNKFKDMNTTTGKTTAGLKAARQESISFGEALKTAIVKFPINIQVGVKLL